MALPFSTVLGRASRRTWWIGALLALSIPIVLAWLLPSRSRVTPGIVMGEVALGGLDWQAARQTIVEAFQNRRARPIVFQGEGGLCRVTLEAVDAQLDVDATLAELRRISDRRRGLTARFRQADPLLARLRFDEAKLKTWLDECEARAIPERPSEGRLIAKELDLVIQPGRSGRSIDRDRIPSLLLSVMARSDDSAVPLPVVDVPERPTRARLEQARSAGLELIAKAVVLRNAASEAKLTMLRADIAKILDWELKPDGELAWQLSRPVFDQWLAPRRHRVEKRARDATYALKGRDRLEVVPEQAGSRIAVDTLFGVLTQALRDGQRQLDIPFEPTELPKRHVADLEPLNIHEPVGAFTTRHACCQPRVTNIHRIADLLNGVIVLPGETFSVNEHVGQRSMDNGFVVAPGIADGEMTDTVGGGVSQFATTLYNAVMRAGYEILERQAHSYWFDRYPMGHEATLSWPKPDLVFRNDTASGLLILTSYDDRSISVRLFGDREGRRVDFSVSSRFDIVRPTIEYLPNSEVEPDDEKVKDGGCIGWSVWTMRSVTLENGTIKKDKRKVIYKPKTRRVEVHPCKIPVGEPGHTGERCPKPEPEEEPSTQEGQSAEPRP